MLSDNSELVAIVRAYQAESLARKAVDVIAHRCPHEQTRVFLQKLASAHDTNQRELKAICDSLELSPSEHFEVPAAIEELLSKNNVPELLLLGWLNKCEIELSEVYGALDQSSSLNEGNRLAIMSERQRKLLTELSLMIIDTTGVQQLYKWVK